MANRIVNANVDPGIRTVQSTVINPATVAKAATVNTKVDPSLSARTSTKVVTPANTTISTQTSTVPITPTSNVSMITMINSIVQNYLDTYSGSLGSAIHADVADSANAVLYTNVVGRPTLSLVATTGSYNDLLNIPSFASYATTSYVDTRITNVINSAPAALDTLNELASALNNDSSFASTITTSLASKVSTTSLTTTLASYATTSYVDSKTYAWTSITGKPTFATVATSGSYNDLTNKPTINADRITNGSYSLVVQQQGHVTIPTSQYSTAQLFSQAGVTLYVGTLDNDNYWQFQSDKKLKLPPGGDIVDSTGTSVLGGGGSTGNIVMEYGTVHLAEGATENNLAISPTLEGFAFIQVPKDSVASTDNVRIHNDAGNVEIGTSNGSNLWLFDNNGNLVLPSGGSLYSISSTPSGAPGNTIVLNPHGSGPITNQKLMLYPTAGDGDHLHMATGNLYETELFLGSDDFYVKLANTGGIVLHANDNSGNTATWTFEQDGNLFAPGNISTSANIYVGSEVNGYVISREDSLYMQAYSNVQIITNSSIPKAWVFDNAGNLTIPEALRFDSGQEIRPAGSDIIGMYSNSAGWDGVGVYTNVSTDLMNQANINIMAGTGGMSAPKLWTFDNTGNLTIPSGGDILREGISVISAEQNFIEKTTNFNILSGYRYGINTSGGAVTATLPSAPNIGDSVYFMDFGGSFSANNLTIARSGSPLQTIMNQTSDLVVSTDGQSFGLAYTGTTWRIY